ncbi:MAG: hypothetical protein K2G83_04195 [Ruminococcus sp.]|nr:hypothetical protein [Ruminococcus sp.]
MAVERIGRITPSSRHTIKHNLSGNKYGKYILRQTLENEIIKFLKNETENYQIISGLGGMGKSSLIFSVLSKILNGEIELGKTVDSIIWVTDSYNPGDLNASKLVDEINAVYGDAASTQVFTGSEEEKRETAKKHLNLSRNMLTILVVDNFETVKNEELRRFIFELPRTCKVILTSKINRDACIENGVIITQNSQCINDFPIPTFSWDEWRILFDVIQSSVFKIGEWAKKFDRETLFSIIRVIYSELDGIPFPFERILTQIADKQLTNVSKIKKLINSTVKGTGGYDRMISYSWTRMEKNSQIVLIAAALGGYLSYLNFIQLSSISGLETYDDKDSPEIGSVLDRAVEQCLNYKLMDVDTSGEVSKYYLPAIVYRYIINRVQNDEVIKREFSDVISNWITYYINKTQSIGMCYNDTEKMREFDSIHQKEALQFVLDYCYSNSMYKEYVVISNNMRYFFYTRSIWEVGDNCVHIKRAYAAHECGDALSELEAYIYYINIASKYRQFEGIETYLERVKELVSLQRIEEEHPESYFRFQHTMGLYLFHKGCLADAAEIWKTMLEEPIITNNTHDIDAAKRWYTKCLMKCSEQPDRISINLESEISALLSEARDHIFERAIIDYTLMLVKIYAQSKQHEKAKDLLHNSEISELIDKTNDVLYKAKYYLWCAGYSSTQQEKEQNTESMKKIIDANGLSHIIETEIRTVENVLEIRL